MQRKSLLWVLVLAAVILVSLGMAKEGGVFPIGSKLDNFTMRDPGGTEHSYNALKGTKGTLIIFLSAQCPIVKLYNDRISEIAAAYKSKGVNFIGIYSNYTESVDWVASHSKEHYKFPVLIDKNNVLADKLGASFTPEVYFFNGSDVLDYHGAIDNDRYGRNISKRFLKTAFDQKLSGAEISEKETRAFGCSIKRIQDKK